VKSFLLQQRRRTDPVEGALEAKITDNNPFVRKKDDDALKPSAGDPHSQLEKRLTKLEAKTAIKQAYETVQDIVHDVLNHPRQGVPPPPVVAPTPEPVAESPAEDDSDTEVPLVSMTPKGLATPQTYQDNGAGQTPAAADPANVDKIIGDIDGDSTPNPNIPTLTAAPVAVAAAAPTAAVATTTIQEPTNPNVPPAPLQFDPETSSQPVIAPVVHPGERNLPESKQEELVDNDEQLEAQAEQDEASKVVSAQGLDEPEGLVDYPVYVGPNKILSTKTRSVRVPNEKPKMVRVFIPPNTVATPSVLKDVEEEVDNASGEMADIATTVDKINRFVPHHRHD
jgi:hypothetical protein